MPLGKVEVTPPAHAAGDRIASVSALSGFIILPRFEAKKDRYHYQRSEQNGRLITCYSKYSIFGMNVFESQLDLPEAYAPMPFW